MTLKEAKLFVQWLVHWAIVIWIVGLVISCTPMGRDDTDDGSWFGGRSGVRPVTDHANGCQYLESSGGALTPRLGKDGRQVGCIK